MFLIVFGHESGSKLLTQVIPLNALFILKYVDTVPGIKELKMKGWELEHKNGMKQTWRRNL